MSLSFSTAFSTQTPFAREGVVPYDPDFRFNRIAVVTNAQNRKSNRTTLAVDLIWKALTEDDFDQLQKISLCYRHYGENEDVIVDTRRGLAFNIAIMKNDLTVPNRVVADKRWDTGRKKNFLMFQVMPTPKSIMVIGITNIETKVFYSLWYHIDSVGRTECGVGKSNYLNASLIAAVHDNGSVANVVIADEQYTDHQQDFVDYTAMVAPEYEQPIGNAGYFTRLAPVDQQVLEDMSDVELECSYIVDSDDFSTVLSQVMCARIKQIGDSYAAQRGHVYRDADTQMVHVVLYPNASIKTKVVIFFDEEPHGLLLKREPRLAKVTESPVAVNIEF